MFIFILKKVHQKEKEKTECVFEIKLSNIKFISLGDGVEVDKKEINFGDEERVDVGVKIRELLCVGNSTKHNMKVQLTTKSGNYKYTLETQPNVVVLESGFACEFEIFLTVECTTTLFEQMLIVTNSYIKDVQKTKKIEFTATSKLTTRLDYHELKEEKKLGEGSFGIVFLGEFRGNKVAIKKMKLSDSESKMQEFRGEVEMLDKFRCDYLVHFYGAVFIPNKVCMVTEFAQYGSLQDLINHKLSSEIDMKLRLKLLVDASEGISYLHEAGILHRDIKPDNILVFSLENSSKANAKITDFGSSRNINLLMTNMTFTAGIGTPKFMSPEVLNRQKYSKGADVYSFAITMLWCITWTDPFPQTVYHYAWSIADDISAGKRPQTLNLLSHNTKSIIEKAWQQDEHKRSSIQQVRSELQTLLLDSTIV
ncbi:tyrosine protein kinase, putative [Entamoeba invadens IP1]|uniref:Tyrosine protein kinase, putative n=1 Tax=Entamoeba invadens IP1 TaxID=370355 RepID=A0A0A1U5Q8_ENTIV|nr:tyrosine protein kinase, putative [Entamoeba invadens IP1]ELP87138.1 tyrosine protein kinase, putative [Entamoeba invadens IP1]|eukprot:XP_004253909.1 tyrosine protein kinase, putative [Entamoeba invadens IP1]